MAYSNFPSYAQVLMDGLEDKPSPNVERSEFEDGFIGQVPRNSRTRYTQPITYRLATIDQKLAFEAWRRDTLRDGALHFAWVKPTHPADPHYQVTRRARIVGGEVSYKPLTNRFDEWSASMVIEYWQ